MHPKFSDRFVTNWTNRSYSLMNSILMSYQIALLTKIFGTICALNFFLCFQPKWSTLIFTAHVLWKLKLLSVPVSLCQVTLNIHVFLQIDSIAALHTTQMTHGGWPVTVYFKVGHGCKHHVTVWAVGIMKSSIIMIWREHIHIWTSRLTDQLGPQGPGCWKGGRWHVKFDMWHMTHDIWHLTSDI